MIRKKVKGLIGEEKMKYCPLWSLFQAMGIERKEIRKGNLKFGTYEPLERQPCIKEECGMYGLCNPFAAEQKEKTEEESKELPTFGGNQ